MRTFVIGDIHGGYKALVQCLERSGFDYDNDRLISLGDTCDGYPDVKQVHDELLKIKNLIMVQSNHNKWALEWMENPKEFKELNHSMWYAWYYQGGKATKKSYTVKGRINVPVSHIRLLSSVPTYFIDEHNNLYVHGGIIPDVPIEQQSEDHLIWNRQLLELARNQQIINNISGKNVNVTSYNKVFIGHTSIWSFSHIPKKFCEIIAMDTGAGYEGKLSIMNVDTEDFWQSDKVSDLYPREYENFG